MKILLSLLVFFLFEISALELIEPAPIHSAMNPNKKQSLVNSVDAHPFLNLICANYTHNNMLVLYQIEGEELQSFQALQDPGSWLNCPSSAIFSKDGTHLIALNWIDTTFTVYHVDGNGFVSGKPEIVSSSLNTRHYKPHGMGCSPDGHYLAVAYGASTHYRKAVALYRIVKSGDAMHFHLSDLLETPEISEGIPKGVAFSPDGSCLLVTLAHTDSICIYEIDWENESLSSVPKQIYHGPETLLSRPEDIKFMMDGDYCAVSDSSADRVSFYRYDQVNNEIVGDAAVFSLNNPEANLSFPHGLAFSADGAYMVISQFGPVIFNEKGDFVSWGNERKDSVSLFRVK